MSSFVYCNNLACDRSFARFIAMPPNLLSADGVGTVEIMRQSATPRLACGAGVSASPRRLRGAAARRDAALVEPLGISQKQFAVLEVIFQNPDVSQVDIAQALSTDRATMMAALPLPSTTSKPTFRLNRRSRRNHRLVNVAFH
ncbi:MULTISPECIES: hypothetical protein [unclassified Mesorhizobium]|uniref:hypothetical protein n=1 Tax=unclassified Mesorhizobium TaxID=325217 RepID=UPI001FED96CF|nr:MULTISPECIES: hypothetical protein [unclassified Mesorhizobium]